MPVDIPFAQTHMYAENMIEAIVMIRREVHDAQLTEVPALFLATYEDWNGVNFIHTQPHMAVIQYSDVDGDWRKAIKKREFAILLFGERFADAMSQRDEALAFDRLRLWVAPTFPIRVDVRSRRIT